MAVPTSPGPVVERTRNQEVALGMMLLGLIFSSILYGVMQTQVYKYYRRFKNDPPLVKGLVLAVWLLDTTSVFFVGHACWYYLVTTGSPHISIWSLNVELALSLVMSAITETFLAMRVYKLSGNVWLTAILLLLACLHFGSGEVAAVEFLQLQNFAQFGSVKIPSILRLGSAALTDTSIAIALSYFLNKKRTGFKRSDEVINYLILFSINSGLLTSLISIASLITYLLVRRLWVYTALCFLISRLYATTFLCSLNSRQILLNNNNVLDEKPPQIPSPRLLRAKWSMKRSPDSSSDGSDGRSPTQIDVFVVTETITDELPRALPPKSRGATTSPTNHLNSIREQGSSSTLGHGSSSSSSSSGSSGSGLYV